MPDRHLTRFETLCRHSSADGNGDVDNPVVVGWRDHITEGRLAAGTATATASLTRSEAPQDSVGHRLYFLPQDFPCLLKMRVYRPASGSKSAMRSEPRVACKVDRQRASFHENHDHNYGFIVNNFGENQVRSYKQIRADIAALEREAAAVRKSESAVIVAKIRKLAEQYGLTAADIGFDAAPQLQAAVRPSGKTAPKSTPRKTATKKMPSGKKTRSGAGVAKYRDPKSGKTWTGFGRAPDWLASAKNRETFRIEPDSMQAKAAPGTAQADATAAKPRAVSKAAGKVAVKRTAKAASGKTASAKKSGGKPSVKRSAGAKAATAKSESDASAKSRAAAAQPVPAEGGQQEPPSDATPS